MNRKLFENEISEQLKKKKLNHLDRTSFKALRMLTNIMRLPTNK